MTTQGAGAVTTRRRLPFAAVVLTAALALAGCNEEAQTDNDDGVAPPEAGAPVSECGSAFAEAASAAPGPESEEAIFGAFEACEDVDDFVQTAQGYPDAVPDDDDAAAYAARLCAEVPVLEGTAVCASLPG